MVTLSNALLALAAAGFGRGLSRTRDGVRHYPEPHCQIHTLGPKGWRPCSPRCAGDRALVELIGRYLRGELREAELPEQLRLVG